MGKRLTLALLAAMSLTTSLIAVQHPPSLARREPRTPAAAINASATVSEQIATTPSVPGMFDAFTVEVAHVDFLAPCGPERWCPPPPPKAKVKARGPPRNGIPPNCPTWDHCKEAIAQCESGGRYDADNPTSSAYGKYQILKSEGASPEAQEGQARGMFEQSGVGPWRETWGCTRERLGQ